MPAGMKVTKNTAKSVLTDYSKRVQTEGKVVVQRSADRAFSMAQGLCAVRTGRTRSKMRKEVTDTGYKVGFLFSDFPEGPKPLWLEFGTRDTPAHPCIIPTREAEKPLFDAECRAVVKP